MEPSDFESFYRANRDDCYRALIVAVGNPLVADDLVAEAFTRALERWEQMRVHPAPKAWVIKVALNYQRDRWRRIRRALRSLTHPNSQVDEPGPPLDPRLLAAVASLSDQQRAAVAYRVMLDLDTETTAEAMGITPGTVTTHLHRGLTHLRQQLHDYEVLT